MKELRRGRNASYGSHESCKSLSEELRGYYGGRHRSHTRLDSQRREKDRRSQEVSISLPYFHAKDNVEACLDWEMKGEQLFACHHISEERKKKLTWAALHELLCFPFHALHSLVVAKSSEADMIFH